MRVRGAHGFAAKRACCPPIAISLLSLDLPAYLEAIRAKRPEELVEDAGLACPRCGTRTCAKPHAWRRRKKITDLSTGDVYEAVPILRIRFCTKTTASLTPADLWRGRSTVSSVIETVAHVVADGLAAAYDWTWQAGEGDAPVSECTLRRWRDLVRDRLIGSALAWLGPRVGIDWSAGGDEGAQLEALLETLTAGVLAAFGSVFGRAVLDKTTVPRPVPRPRRAAPRGAGRHDRDASPDPPRPVRPRGSWSVCRSRGPPPGDLLEASRP